MAISAAPASPWLVGYFSSAAAADKKLQLKNANIPADRLTHIVYAFADVNVDGVCSSVNAELDKINFPQLLDLKKQHAGLMTLISIGGASHSGNFAKAAATDATRAQLAQSCVNFMKANGFDGIDIDWEFPGPGDKANFTALLKALRAQLDIQGAADGRRYLLTIAAPAGRSHSANLDLGTIHPFLDWINLMTYDYVVAGSATTGLVAPLHAPPDDPSSSAAKPAENVDSSVGAYLAAGVPAAKVLLGVRFVGTGWQGVPDVNHGLFQKVAPPVEGGMNVASVDFGDLENTYLPAYPRYWHAQALVPWLYNTPNSGVLISYEDTQSLGIKANYALSKQLGGVFIWYVNADDAQWTLINALAGTVSGGADAKFTVTGTVASPTSASVGGLQVQLVDKNVGGDIVLSSTTTDRRGNYQIVVVIPPVVAGSRSKPRPDLQAKVYSGTKYLAASDVKYDAPVHLTLNVQLPSDASALISEHEALTSAVATAYPGKLGALQENKDRQDITYLANKTGWDARAVAMAALADQFGQAAVPAAGAAAAPASIKPEFYYALFRSGLPANADTLYQASPKYVQSVWEQSIKQGLIPASLAGEVAGAVQTFQAFGAKNALTAKPLVGISTLQDLLHISLGGDAGKQLQFAQLYTQYRDDPPTFWTNVEKTLGKDTATKLRLDGQLGVLTINNAAVIGKLYDAEKQAPITASLDLAHRGYYQAPKWKPLVVGAIPPQIPGATAAEKAANYAELLAAQVRLAYPTAIIADMVTNGVLPIQGPAEVAKGVSTFFTANQGKFEIGIEPVDRYLARTQIQGTPAPVVDQIKRLQRVYQITPHDQAMTALLQKGLDSAYAITRYDADSFVRTFGNDLGGADAAGKVHAKARQVHGAVLNLTSAYLVARRAPGLGGIGDGYIYRPWPRPKPNPNFPVTAYPTLEGLFGSMDFCACSECRSILSPAAYMVDLLQFLDCAAPHIQNPQVVLLGRRPDLQYLPLTCENTNVVLPYIDLVNETLEYYVANGSLNNYQGHDTGSQVSSAELLASPQYVNDAAYAALQTADFPPPLPFHRALELLRRHFQKLGEPLQDAMAALRPSEALERGAAAYGWRDILMEQIGLSRLEYGILTDSTLKLQVLYGYPTLSDADVITALSGVQEYARRAGVTYDYLFSILKTRFINPARDLIPRLERLDVPFATLQALKNGAITPAAFLAHLPAGIDPGEYGGDIVKWVTDPKNYPRIMGLITVSNPTNSTDLCSAAALQLRYTNPDNAANTLHAIDFVRLIRFIRLWRKLGLTIEQTDALITALYPAADLPVGNNDAQDLLRLDAGFLVLLPRIGFLFQVINRLNLTPVRDLARLLACWAPIGTAGESSLYASMFLTPTLLRQDPAFADDGYGNFLQDNTKKLLDHAPALRAAFNLTGAELTLIAGDLGFDGTTVLNLDNVSAIYRRGWLARTLRLSVVEFLLLTRYTGLDPFAPPDPVAVAPAEPPIIRLIRLVQSLSAASLRPVQALYLIWNQDVSGKSAPPDFNVTGLARTLRADFAAVEAQFTLVNDPKGEIAKALMGLVYDTATTDFFFGLLNTAVTTSAPYAGPQPVLAAPILQAASGRLSYDDLRKLLTYSGVLDDPTLNAIQAAVTANGNDAALHAALTALSLANQKVVAPFFTSYPELLPLYTAYAVSNDPPQTKRTTLLANFLPGLKQKRKQEQAMDAVTSAAGTDPSFAPALLQDAKVLQAAGAATAAIGDLTALETPGLSVQFFLTNNTAAPPDQSFDAVAVLDYAPGGSNPLPPGQGGGPIAGIWSGYIEAPQDGFYNIAVATDAGAAVTLSVDGNPIAMAKAAGTWSNQAPIKLTAGKLTPIVLTVTTISKTVTVKWESSGLGWQVIPGASLYSATLMSRFRSTFARFLKSSSLASDLSLTAAEIAFLAADADLAIGGTGWLNSLAPSGNPTPAISIDLRTVLIAVLDFARIKQALSPSDTRLLGVLQNPSAVLPDSTVALLKLTGWSQDSLNALLMQFYGDTQLSHLSHVENLRRVYDAYAVVTTCGLSASALVAATTNDPTAAIVRDLQSALRALYAESDWLAVVKPINDAMRDLQRDALVAFVLQRLAADPNTATINTPDALFEYLLMDVQMEPCQQTSRIRHALSSIQLFIEMCSRSLVPQVSALDINTQDWVWMKRYRVWQANREVFLWPENWLDEELRDDQSAFCKETMSELLQGDITDDGAAVAYLNYLTKLEEVAKLEPCGIYYIPNDPKVDELAHVIARTSGARRKYYYRRLEGASWTPWEDTKLDIEDVPVAPYVWNDRLLLFWIKIVKQTPTDPSTLPPPSSDPNPLTKQTIGGLQSAGQAGASTQTQVTVQAVLCWSEYYNGKWQGTKTSDPNRPTTITTCPPSGPNAFDRSQLKLNVGPLPGLPADTLFVDIEYPNDYGDVMFALSGFVLYNTHSLPVRVEDISKPAFQFPSEFRIFSTQDPAQGTNTFSIYYYPPAWSQGVGQATQNDILQSFIGERVIEPQPGTSWDAPFFFQDSRSVFYVTTNEALVAIGEFDGFGIANNVSSPSVISVINVPPIISKPLTGPPDPIGPVIVPSGPIIGDPVALASFVGTDANIRAALGTTATVAYQGQLIGPSGALSGAQPGSRRRWIASRL
jgi:GH18 family chitinase